MLINKIDLVKALLQVQDGIRINKIDLEAKEGIKFIGYSIKEAKPIERILLKKDLEQLKKCEGAEEITRWLNEL